MIIVITKEEWVKNEAEIINQMFHEGLDLLHFRKPFFKEDEMRELLDSVDQSFHSQLVLHNHYHLAKEYAISRLHFREVDRLHELYKPLVDKSIISTSVHDINDYNALQCEWEYSFISPVFPSISKKGYGVGTKVLEEIKNRNNPEVQLIALGGIDENTIQRVFDFQVDGVALLGAVWDREEPLTSFEKIKNAVLS